MDIQQQVPDWQQQSEPSRFSLAVFCKEWYVNRCCGRIAMELDKFLYRYRSGTGHEGVYCLLPSIRELFHKEYV